MNPHREEMRHLGNLPLQQAQLCKTQETFLLDLVDKIWYLQKVLLPCTGLGNVVNFFIQRVGIILPRECQSTGQIHSLTNPIVHTQSH